VTPTTQPVTPTTIPGLTPFNPGAISTLGVSGAFSGQYQSTQFSPSGWALFQNGQWYNAPAPPPTSQVQLPDGRTITVYSGYATTINNQPVRWTGSRWEPFSF